MFARYLNVTTGLISQWERGREASAGGFAKLLSLVARNGLGRSPKCWCSLPMKDKFK